MYVSVYSLKNQETKNQKLNRKMGKWTKGWAIHKRNIKVILKHMKKCSTSLIREMQLQTTYTKVPFHTQEMGKNSKISYPLLSARLWGNRLESKPVQSHGGFSGNNYQNYYVTFTLEPRNLTPRHLPWGYTPKHLKPICMSPAALFGIVSCRTPPWRSPGGQWGHEWWRVEYCVAIKKECGRTSMNWYGVSSRR